MKTFILSLLFMAAALLPILFFPLLALTLIALVMGMPYLMTHDIWPHSSSRQAKYH
jgi:hypothetical protein